jgi:hypothetical protein
MLELKNVTLVATSSVKLNATIKALEYSMKDIVFGESILITHENLEHEKICIKKCEKIKTLDEYSHFMVYKLKDYINTDFALIVQHDGFVVNPKCWSDDFFNYDYIGAPWPKNMFFDDFGENIRVGNGGFSFRSRKILNAPTLLNLEWAPYRGYYNEDGFLTVSKLKDLGQYGIKYAPVDIAYKFSREIECEDLDNNIEPFGIHNYYGKNLNYPKF